MQSTLLKLTISVSLLALSACGNGKINAKNGETLHASVQKIGAKMDEADRQEFGQDFMALSESVLSDDGSVALSALYPKNYSMLFTPPTEGGVLAGNAQALYSDLALKGKDRFHKKSPAALHKEAQALRAALYTDKAQELTASRKDMDIVEQTAKTKIAEREAELEKAREMETQYSDQQSRAIENLKPVWASYNKGQNKVTFDSTADITNFADVPISGAYFSIAAELADNPGYRFETLPDKIAIKPPLPPGETRKGVKFKTTFLGFSRVIKDEGLPHMTSDKLFGQPTQLKSVQANFEDYVDENAKPLNFGLNGNQKQILKDNENLIERCQAYLRDLEAVKSAMDDQISQLQALAQDPKPETLIRVPNLNGQSGC